MLYQLLFHSLFTIRIRYFVCIRPFHFWAFQFKIVVSWTWCIRWNLCSQICYTALFFYFHFANKHTYKKNTTVNKKTALTRLPEHRPRELRRWYRSLCSSTRMYSSINSMRWNWFSRRSTVYLWWQKKRPITLRIVLDGIHSMLWK